MALAWTRSSSLSDSTSTVARPMAVLGIIRERSSLHVKWSDHVWAHGLKRGTVSPASGSSASSNIAFFSLHSRQDSHKFSLSSLPPLALGVLYSSQYLLTESSPHS